MRNYTLQSAYSSKSQGIEKTKLIFMNLFFPQYTEWELYQMKNINGRVYNVYAQTNKLTGKVRYKKSKAKFVNKLIRHQ
jgi:hypothetical protein